MPKPIKGKTYLYKGEQHEIQEVKFISSDLFDVYTDKRRIRVPKKEFVEFLPVDVPKSSQMDKAMVLFAQQTNGPLESLADKLMKVIANIEENKDFIPQAEAINETAKNLIALQKTRIDLVKAVKVNHGKV
jgi:hypothetical protein